MALDFFSFVCIWVVCRVSVWNHVQLLEFSFSIVETQCAIALYGVCKTFRMTFRHVVMNASRAHHITMVLRSQYNFVFKLCYWSGVKNHRFAFRKIYLCIWGGLRDKKGVCVRERETEREWVCNVLFAVFWHTLFSIHNMNFNITKSTWHTFWIGEKNGLGAGESVVPTSHPVPHSLSLYLLFAFDFFSKPNYTFIHNSNIFHICECVGDYALSVFTLQKHYFRVFW